MSKILISPLGTGRIDYRNNLPVREYRKAEYKIEDEIISEDLLAKVLIDKYKLDKVFFIGTAKSLWELVYSKFGGTNDDLTFSLLEKAEKSNADNYYISNQELIQVETQIDGYIDKQGSKCILMKYGRDEGELLYNFNIFMDMANQLVDGDELYIDITHSFRSLSFFSYLMSSFLENLKSKNITLKKVFYGNLDIISEVGYAPVVDLSLFYKLNSWSKLISDITTFGKIDKKTKVDSNSKVFREIQGLVDALNINNLEKIKKSIHKLKTFKNSNLEVPFKYLYPELMRFLKRFKDTDPDFRYYLKLSLYYSEIDNYALAYITLTESILLFFIAFIDKERKLTLEVQKNKVKRIIHNKRKLNPLFTPLANRYKTINNIRKNIAHTLENRGALVESDIEKFNEHYIFVLNKFSALKDERSITEE